MKTVKSRERSTGMGATRFEAILMDGRWTAISQVPNARYEGRAHGEEFYEIDVADDAISAHFYRSNSGRERVSASNGLEWKSFESADRWASAKKVPSTLIVTRHPGVVAWLKERGIKGETKAHVTAEDVRGKHVYGNLPLNLAAEATKVTMVLLPGLRPEQRGKDLSLTEMVAAGAMLASYTVKEV